MNNFSEISLSAPLRSNLLKHGYTKPTPVQAQAIEPALAGSDVVATAQTGTGKTLAFVLPVIQRIGSLIGKQPSSSGIRAVILSPTRELALQTQETFAKMAVGTGVRTAIAIGGLNENPQLTSIRKGAQVLIATPGRLFDFLSRQLVNFSGVRILVLDEADRMLDLGFLPTIKRLMDAMPADRQTLFFSATIESSVKHLVETHVRNAVRIEVGSISKPIEKVALHVYEVEQDRKLGLLARMLRDEHGSFLVFTRTKHGSDRLSKRLAQEGVKTAVIHGDRSQNQRSQALSGFQTGYYRVLVATDIAARGIHVEGIAHVVNYDLPQVPEDFIHRIGRTGRAGAHGKASTFATRAERADIARIERAVDTRLERRKVPTDILGEKSAAPVVVIPHVKQVRSFGPRNRFGRRPARRAV
jgi:ATP-dependent RNA helicase RhlE